jgi:hypothetical protein
MVKYIEDLAGSGVDARQERGERTAVYNLARQTEVARAPPEPFSVALHETWTVRILARRAL